MFNDGAGLALAQGIVQFHEEIWRAEVAVVLWYLVLQDQMVAPCVPGQFADQTMILMEIVPVMSKDEVRRNLCLQFLKESFYLAPVVGQEPILELLDQNFFASSLFEKCHRAAPRFLRSSRG